MNNIQIISRLQYIKALLDESFTISNIDDTENYNKIEKEFNELIKKISDKK